MSSEVSHSGPKPVNTNLWTTPLLEILFKSLVKRHSYRPQKDPQAHDNLCQMVAAAGVQKSGEEDRGAIGTRQIISYSRTPFYRVESSCMTRRALVLWHAFFPAAGGAHLTSSALLCRTGTGHGTLDIKESRNREVGDAAFLSRLLYHPKIHGLLLHTWRFV